MLLLLSCPRCKWQHHPKLCAFASVRAPSFALHYTLGVSVQSTGSYSGPAPSSRASLVGRLDTAFEFVAARGTANNAHGAGGGISDTSSPSIVLSSHPHLGLPHDSRVVRMPPFVGRHYPDSIQTGMLINLGRTRGLPHFPT